MSALVVAITNLKGGVAKTSTAAGLAHAAVDLSSRVVALDCDPQRSLTTWSEWAGWALPVEWYADPAPRARQLAAAGWTTIVDTPPLDRGAVSRAVAAADVVIAPLSPSPADAERLPALVELLDQWAPQARRHALLTRVPYGVRGPLEFRALLTSWGWDVLTTEVPRRERIAAAFGGALTPSVVAPFAAVWREITHAVVPAEEATR